MYMYGYLIFNCIFINLNELLKQKIIENIFNIKQISCYYISVDDNKISFRIFSNSTFYQYTFIMQDNDISTIKNVDDSRIILKYFKINEYKKKKDFGDDALSIFIKILLSSDEAKIYHLFQNLL